MEGYMCANISKGSWENVIPSSHNPTGEKKAVEQNRFTREYKYISYKEALENLRRSSEYHLNEKLFLDKEDKEAKKFIDSVEEEIATYVNGSIEDIKCRGRKDKSFTAWILLKGNARGMKIDESFLIKAYNDIKVTAVTLLVSKDEERGLRISLDENQTRLYDIINGSYEIRFNWKVNDKDCGITVNIDSDGTVTYISPSNSLTSEDFDKNKDVRIRIGGIKSSKMTLTELISHGRSQCESFSVVG